MFPLPPDGLTPHVRGDAKWSTAPHPWSTRLPGVTGRGGVGETGPPGGYQTGLERAAFDRRRGKEETDAVLVMMTTAGKGVSSKLRDFTIRCIVELWYDSGSKSNQPFRCHFRGQFRKSEYELDRKWYRGLLMLLGMVIVLCLCKRTSVTWGD